MNIESEIRLKYAIVQRLPNNIVRLEMFDNVIIGFIECREMNNAIGKLTNRLKALILMVPGNSTQFLPEARDFSASPEGQQFTLADALVVSNLGQRILMSFYLKFNRPPSPSQAFDTEEHAMEWLLSLPK
ncbi:MAG: hypothetical protein K0R26_851 [Bacteroidota bacterium]|jgi:hypothetical protein|nr:hypothetical protein [Bacteroidota bacterium]